FAYIEIYLHVLLLLLRSTKKKIQTKSSKTKVLRGDYDDDRKMDDLKLLYIAYIVDALSGGRMEKDKMGIEMFRGYWDCLGLLQLRCLKGCWKSNTTTYNINNNYAQPSSRSLLKAATTYGRNDMDIGMAIMTDGSRIELSSENLFLLENGPLEFILIPNCYFIFKNRDSEAVSFYSLRSRLGPLMSLVKVRAGSKVCLQKANMLFGPSYQLVQPTEMDTHVKISMAQAFTYGNSRAMLDEHFRL
ncbi:hypothetical protein Tco_0874792, partial [Tanacetum coccineum]